MSIFSGESYEDETQDSSDYGAESRNSQGRLPEELQFLKTRDLLCHLAQHLQQELASRVRFDLTSKVTKGWSSSVDSTYLNQLRHNLVLKTLKQADAGRAFHCVTAGLHGELFDLLLNTPELINVRDTSGCGLLHRAVEKGYAEMVNLLVSRGIDINTENNVGDCPLHLAVQTSRIDIVTKLLEYGANPRCTNKEGEQPIHMAAQVNFVEGVKLLLIYPEVTVDCLDARKSTPLHHCCLADSEDCLKMLLEHGANIYQRNVFGSASIHIAIFQVALKCANALFEYEQLKMCQGALLNPSTASVQQDASTPRKKKTSLLSFLTEKTGSAKLESRRSSRQPSVHSTVSDSDMHQLVHMMDEEGFSPLHMAVHSGNIELIKMCLDRGADILGSDKSGHSALHFACARGDLECAKLLFEYGQRVALRMIFAVDQDGRTPMHMAAMHNHPDLIDFLLEKGADMNPTDSKGLTPLLLACQKGSIKATKHLLEIGADTYKCDENGRNLSILLLLGGTGDAREVVPVLVKMGILPVLFTQPDRYGCTYMHVAARLGQRVAIKIGLANGGKLLQRDSEGSTALHSAARFGRLDICRQMLETTEGKRALFLRDYSGRSPLHLAAQYGNNRVVEYLLAKGGFYHRCNDGNTPLHYAAMFGNAQTCDMLLEINPSVLNYTNYVGSTALHIAAQHDNAGVVSYLLSAGAEILPDKNGLYFTIQAFHSDNYAASEAIAVHSRFSEIVDHLRHSNQCALESMVRYKPALFAKVMDRHITQDETENNLRLEKFDLTILQEQPEDAGESAKRPLWLIKLMVQLERDELLVHPLCTAYLQAKWNTYGRWVQFLVTLYHLMLSVTITWLSLRQIPLMVDMELPKAKWCLNTLYAKRNQSTSHRSVLAILLICTGLQMAVKIFLLVTEKWQYFKDLTNCLLLISQCLFVTTVLINIFDYNQPYCAALTVVAMFNAWFNFFMQLSRFRSIGIFVIMFLQVGTTLFKSALVLSTVFVGFAVTFHKLFTLPEEKEFENLADDTKNRLAHCFLGFQHLNYTTEELRSRPKTDLAIKVYGDIRWALFQTLMMMVGEYDHTEVVVRPYLDGYSATIYIPELTFPLFAAFIFLVPIASMNLLVGLAVGDIDKVRQSATHQLISHQVYWLDELEARCPKWLQKRIYIPYCFKRSEGAIREQGGQEYEAKRNLIELARKLEDVGSQLKLQSDKLGQTATQLGITSHETENDEGDYEHIKIQAIQAHTS